MTDAQQLVRERYEILPLGAGEQQALELPEPVRLTITCSPKHGPDRSVELGGRLRAHGHAVTVHVAARMVRDAGHLDVLLESMSRSGIDDLFLVGGDIAEPQGCYSSAVELLGLIDGHPQRPRAIGIAAYPEGHPLIDAGTLERALFEKSRWADYITTQLDFHPDQLLAWVRGRRAAGLALPVYFGVPGKVHTRRLLELSMRIGVGESIGYLRKQHGFRHIIGRSAADRLFDELAPAVGDPELGIAGFHYFTFNELRETWEWRRQKLPASAARLEPGDRSLRRGEAG